MVFNFRVLRALTIIIALGLSTIYGPFVALGATLTDLSLGINDTVTSATNVTYTFNATLASTSDVQEIHIRYSTTDGGTTKPAHMVVTGATLASITGLGSGWTLDTSNASNGLLQLTNASPQSLPSGTVGTAVIDGITNSALDDCQPEANGLTDRCYVAFTTYSDAGSTSVDTGSLPYTLHEEPVLSFEVKGVASGVTHNGITTTTTSTPTAISFGKISPNGVSYAMQEIDISTNAPGGYTVSAVLAANLHGAYNNAEIDPFAGLNVTWTTPQAWSTPDGTTPNNNTGWLGANTSDSRVSGWSGNTQAKFGPFGTISRTIAYTTSADSGSTIYVSYALGINAAQPADQYSGTLIYTVQTNY
jgi:hypothetical protein